MRQARSANLHSAHSRGTLFREPDQSCSRSYDRRISQARHWRWRLRFFRRGETLAPAWRQRRGERKRMWEEAKEGDHIEREGWESQVTLTSSPRLRERKQWKSSETKRHRWQLAAPSCLARELFISYAQKDVTEKLSGLEGQVECEWESTEWSSTFDVVEEIENGSSNSNARVDTWHLLCSTRRVFVTAEPIHLLYFWVTHAKQGTLPTIYGHGQEARDWTFAHLTLLDIQNFPFIIYFLILNDRIFLDHYMLTFSFSYFHFIILKIIILF